MWKRYAGLYGSGKLSNPDGEVKDEKYALEKVQYYYGMFASGQTLVSPNYQITQSGRVKRSIHELRAHARGVQSPLKYQNMLDPVRRKGEGKGHRRWNISWDPIKVLSRHRNDIKDKFMSLMLTPTTKAFNEIANEERLTLKNTLKLQVLPETKAFIAGDYVPQDVEIEDADTPEDVEFLYKMGGLQLPIEIELKDIIDSVVQYSDWPVIAEMCIEDVIDLNAMAIDVEEVNGEDRIKYVDFAKAIIEPSVYPDFRDSTFRGYVESMKPEMLFLQYPEEFSDPKLKEEVKNLSLGQLGYDRLLGDGRREDFAFHTNSLYSDFGVKTVKMYWVDYETKGYIVGRHPSGNKILKEVKEFTKVAKDAGLEYVERSIPFLYQARWIVGTDIILGFSPVDAIVRDSKRVQFPMPVYCGHEQSIIEKCIATDDDLQIANYKRRNVIRKIPPYPRMVLFKDKLKDSINIAGEDYSIGDQLREFQLEGIMVLEGRDEYNLPGEDISKRERIPYEFLPSGALEDLTIFTNEVNAAIERIRTQIGQTDISTESQKVSYMSGGFIQTLNAAASSAIRPYINLYINATKSMYRYIARHHQVKVLAGEVRVRLPEGGTLKVDRRIMEYDFNIDVDIVSSDYINILLADLNTRRDLIPPPAYFTIMNAIQDGDVKKAQYLLAKYTDKAEKIAHQRNLEIQAATAQANQAAAAASMQVEQSKIQAKGIMDQEYERLKSLLELALKKEESQLKLKEMERKSNLDTEKELAVVEANNRNRLQQ